MKDDVAAIQQDFEKIGQDIQAAMGMTHSDLINLTTPGRKAANGDPGAVARDRLKSRASKLKTAVVRTYIVLTTLVLLALGGAGWYVYDAFTNSASRYVDYRPCSYVDEANGITITGRREFSYMQHSVLGMQFRMEGKVDEKTQIDVQGESMTVVGMTGSKWWATYIDVGERGIQILKPADVYVITTKKKAAIIDYSAFCR